MTIRPQEACCVCCRLKLDCIEDSCTAEIVLHARHTFVHLLVTLCWLSELEDPIGDIFFWQWYNCLSWTNVCLAVCNTISAVQLSSMQSSLSLQHTQQASCGRIVIYNCQRTVCLSVQCSAVAARSNLYTDSVNGRELPSDEASRVTSWWQQ